MVISNVICPYQGTAEELEEEFEGKVNYLFLSNAIKDLWKSSPFGEKWFWIYITKEQAIMYVAKINGFVEWPDKINTKYKNAEKFNSVKVWKSEAGRQWKYAYRVGNLYKLHDPIPRELLEEKYNVKGKIWSLIYNQIDWETLTQEREINQEIKIF